MRRYTVYMANNDVLHLHRGWIDSWWFDDWGTMVFHDEEERKVTIPKRWIVKIVMEK